MSPAEIIAELEAAKAKGANEAETRLKIINHVLFDVLGWTYVDAQIEERVSEDGQTSWADFVLRTGMTGIVVEAKKALVALDEIPPLRRSQLRGRFVSGETGAAITQARDYARKLSIPFACVTNGDKWIVFPATRVDQIPFSQSSAIIFPSIKSALHDDFAEFHDILSRSAAIGGRLESELLGRIENQIDERRLNRFFTTSFSKITRHSLFPLIQDAITTSFTEDIVNVDAELLEKCYVQTPERVRFDARIGMYIGRRDSVTARAPQRPMRGDKGISGIVGQAALRAKPLAVLVLGQVGAGKTTFLDFTRKVRSSEAFKPTLAKPYPHWMKVDFKPFSKSDTPLDFILRHLKALISEDPFLSSYERCIQYAYKDEIDALFRGPLFLLGDNVEERRSHSTRIMMADYEATRPYVEKIISYAAKNVPIYLVIDNIDQVDNESDQAAIFADAMAFAQITKVNLICAMRESTFVTNRSSALFDAFDFDPIVIDPPSVPAVLSRRFFLAKQLLEGRPASFTAENGAEVHVNSLSTVIEMVQSSVLGTEIGNLIEVLSTSDIRLALRMTREFLQSGWTASGKALNVFSTTGRYVMPQHEALRAIMLGNHQVYSEEQSVIGNPLDAHLSRTEAQLVRLYVLNAIVLFSGSRSFRYLEGSEIQKSLREIGFGDTIALRVVTDLCRLRFMHTVAHTKPSLEASFIVSRLGGYVVRHFLADMMFLENIMVDTFIADDHVWDELRGLTSRIYAERNILGRMTVRKERVQKFFEYMKGQYEPLRSESIRRGLPKEWCGNPFEASETEFRSRLSRAMRSAERNYGAEAPNA